MKKLSLILSAVFILVLFGLPAFAAPPLPDIKANGLDGPVVVTADQNVDITVSLNPGDKAGHLMEWWIAARTDFGWFYLNNTLNWVSSPAPVSVGTFGLFSLPSTSILNIPLPVGSYAFYFALDDILNGVADSLAYYDVVDVSSTAQPVAAIALAGDPLIVPADGTSSSTITAHMSDNHGDPVPVGTPITFQTDLGTFPNGETIWTDQTYDNTGEVTTFLSAATTPGNASVTASSGAVTSNAVTVTFRSIEPHTVTLDANPVMALADGVDTSILTAMVLTVDNYPVPNGTIVNFDITSGTGTLSAPSATTVDGHAQVRLASGTVGNVVVQAEVADYPALPKPTATVAFVSPAPASITLQANPSQVPADGETTSNITATVLTADNYPVQNGTVVNFSIVSGTGALSAGSAETVNGKASVTLKSSAIGAVSVKAEVATQPGLNQTITVTFTALPPASVELTASPDELPGDGHSLSTLTATVKDADGNLVPDGTVINFAITSGIGVLSAGSATTASGTASITLSSGTVGTVTVKATAAQGGANSSVTVTFTRAPGSLSLSTNQTTVRSDNSDRATITATVLDFNYVPFEGMTVMFSVDGGQISASTKETDANGEAKVTVSSGTANKSNRVITVTASVTGLPAKVIPIQVVGTTVSVTTDRENLELDPVNPDKANAALTVLVKDAGGIPIFDAPVTLSVDPASTGSATLTPSSGQTDVAGKLQAAVTGTGEGEVFVEAQALGASDSQTYHIGAVGEVFSIIFPETDPARMYTLGRAIAGPTGDISFNAAALTIVRTDGDSFVSEGFKAGAQIMVNGSVSNDGLYVVAAVAADTLTLAAGSALTDEGEGAEVTITEIEVSQTAQMGPSANIAFTTGPDVITRSDGGSFVADGFIGGSKIVVAGSLLNDGIYTVATADVASLKLLGSGLLVNEGAGANVTLTQIRILPATRDVSITGPSGQISFDAATQTITRADGGSFLADGFLDGDRISVGGSDVNDGQYVVETVAAASLTLSDEDALQDEAAGAQVIVTNGLIVTALAPDQNKVVFATTYGTWDGTASMAVTKDVNATTQQAMAVLCSRQAGIATVEASDKDNPSLRDAIQVAISTASSEASQLSLQASAYVVAPSIGEVSNTVTLTATVRNVADQVVWGVPVAFSIENPTGGGESISPVIVYTDDFGIARSTFTSGTLSSGAEGVRVKASVVGRPDIMPAGVSIVIGGTAGSIVIGRGTSMVSVDNDTTYQLPMSVLVVDSNGNAVSGALVSLNAWPLNYAQGNWVWDPLLERCIPVREATYANEDRNRNLILDNYDPDLCGTPNNGEDTNGDCQLTPSNSASGAVPGAVITDENGVATFDLVFLKSSAEWIHAEITASTMVLGTETQSTSTFWLPHLIDDAKECSLPDSPYNEERPVAQIAVSATPSVLLPDGMSTSIIAASVTDEQGDPVADGERVDFGITGGTAGGGLPDAQNATSYTVNGIATVTYRASTTAGTCQITASTRNGVSGSVEIELNRGSIALSANPAELLANGTSTSLITAMVTDGNGDPVEDYERIDFQITSGSGGLPYSTTTWEYTIGGVASVTYQAGEAAGDVTIKATAPSGASSTVTVTLITGAIALTAVPDNIICNGTSESTISANVTGVGGAPVPDGTRVNFSISSGGGGLPYLTTTSSYTTGGVATATYRSSESPGNVVITASITSGASGNATVTLSPVTIDLAAVPNSLPADGNSESTINATVTDANGDLVPDGERISFVISQGSGGLPYSTSTVVYTVGGSATATYRASQTPGTVKITASGAGNGNDTVDIELVGGGVGSISVTSGSASIVADGVSQTSIFAQVKDTNGTNVPDGTLVSFSTTAGALSAASATTTNGVATVLLTSGANVGTATVTAACGGVSGTVGVEFIAGAPAQVTVTADPVNLTADGVSTSTIRVVVLDANDNPVADDTKLTFSVQFGTLSNLTALTTDGVASVTYTAPTAVPAGDRDTITARTVNNVQGAAPITLIGAQIATITLSASPASLPADGASTATITATLTVVGGGDPPDGTTVNFSITQGGGSITASATTSGGVASATLTSGNVAETATIQGEAGGRTAQIDVEYTPGSVTLTIIPNALLGTGDKTATVTALLKNADGTPAADGETVNFSLSDQELGDIPASADTAGGEGKAEVTFEAGTKGGTVTVTGTWTTLGVDVTGTADITIYPPPAFIQVAEGYPNPTSINISGTGGQSTSQIVFDVKDSAGGLVADGYKMCFSILSGPNGGEAVSPTWTTTSNGQVSTILTSGYRSGPVSVKANYFDNTNIFTATGDIAIVSGPPVGEGLGIFPGYVNVSGLWKWDLRDGVVVSASDIYGNAVPDGTAISFKTYNTGGLFDPGAAGTTGGLAGSELISAATPTPMQGFVSITGEAINGGRTTHVTSLSIDPDSRNVMLAGTDGGGVYKSIDSAATWRTVSASSTLAGQNWIDPYVNDVAIDPDNTHIVYAATGYLGKGRVYRSLDGALNWNSNNPEEFNGVFTSDSAVLTVLCDEAGDYVWVGTQADGVWYTTDGTATPSITWTQAGTLGKGTAVADIVKVPGTHGATAVLYAGTAGGVFRSTNGGATWTPCTAFAGNSIKTLALHPSSTGGGTDILYAGTVDAGVYYSTSSGGAWTQHVTGMGRGLSASTPVADLQNTGTGVMSTVTVGDDALSENWTVTCKTAAADGGVFSVTGTVSGAQGDYDITAGGYSIPNVLAFSITAGGTDFAVGDRFTFSTTRDPGREIMDLLVDEGNDFLYAVTYFWGPMEPHAVGNVYGIGLDPGTFAPTGTWVEATDGLPEYDPPDDTTLFAQHVMASDVPPYLTGAPSALYIGGEGISLYHAATDLAGGDPQWQQSDSGLTNRIMARRPVLFSGQCTLDVSEAAAGELYTYTIYVQDENGNPPIAGSRLKLEAYDGDGQLVETPLDVTYPDAYTHEGTWRDPSDASTNDPYVVTVDFDGEIQSVTITFVPTCEDEAPGCSGSQQAKTYSHAEV